MKTNSKNTPTNSNYYNINGWNTSTSSRLNTNSLYGSQIPCLSDDLSFLHNTNHSSYLGQDLINWDPHVTEYIAAYYSMVRGDQDHVSIHKTENEDTLDQFRNNNTGSIRNDKAQFSSLFKEKHRDQDNSSIHSNSNQDESYNHQLENNEGITNYIHTDPIKHSTVPERTPSSNSLSYPSSSASTSLPWWLSKRDYLFMSIFPPPYPYPSSSSSSMDLWSTTHPWISIPSTTHSHSYNNRNKNNINTGIAETDLGKIKKGFKKIDRKKFKKNILLQKQRSNVLESRFTHNINYPSRYTSNASLVIDARNFE
eukprot:gb/GECH01014916.1/.p1 GENE.gb/GECH01014916.1/~~gb/GECH01014916.1/.p1  ORF type:complete len:311 (+),score=56.02 gb/GECH01014916.1/:1-933(+)